MVFFFTGTGNSLYAARRIAQATHDQAESIAQLMRGGAQAFGADAIGIVCPVYGHDLPPLVKRFLRTMAFQTDYFYLVLTYGNRHGGATEVARRFLDGLGLEVAYTNDVLMVDNWLPGFDIVQQLTLDKHIDEKLNGICADLTARRRYLKPATEQDLRVYREGLEKHGDIFENPQFLNGMLQITDACTGCGICKSVCPAGCIELVREETGARAVRPAHDEPVCTACLACINACPAKAIHMPMGEKNPHARFRNEHVTLTDLITANGSL